MKFCVPLAQNAYQRPCQAAVHQNDDAVRNGAQEAKHKCMLLEGYLRDPASLQCRYRYKHENLDVDGNERLTFRRWWLVSIFQYLPNAEEKQGATDQ